MNTHAERLSAGGFPAFLEAFATHRRRRRYADGAGHQPWRRLWSFWIDGIRAVAARLLLDEFPHGHPGGFGPVNVAHSIRDHAFADALGLRLRAQARDERLDRAVPHAADPDAPLEARVELRIRLVIGHINRVVPVDEDPARPAELLPLF